MFAKITEAVRSFFGVKFTVKEGVTYARRNGKLIALRRN